MRLAWVKLTLVNVEEFRLALVRLAPVRLALLRFADVRSALARFAPRKSAFVRLVASRQEYGPRRAPARFLSANTQPERSFPSRMIPLKSPCP